jgi:hypothetical protein
MTALTIFEEAIEQFPEAMGASPRGRLRDRDGLLRKLAAHRRRLFLAHAGVYLLAFAIAAAGLWWAAGDMGKGKGLLPYLGGTAVIALLALMRAVAKEWWTTTLPLLMAEHMSDSELAAFLRATVNGTRKTPTKPASTS